MKPYAMIDADTSKVLLSKKFFLLQTIFKIFVVSRSVSNIENRICTMEFYFLFSMMCSKLVVFVGFSNNKYTSIRKNYSLLKYKKPKKNKKYINIFYSQILVKWFWIVSADALLCSI